MRLHAPTPDVVVVRVSGALDRTAAPLLTERVRQQFPRAHTIVVDLGDVTFLGARALAALQALQRQSARAGVCLHLAADHNAVCRPLHIAGLDQTLAITPSADLILAQLACCRTTG